MRDWESSKGDKITCLKIDFLSLIFVIVTTVSFRRTTISIQHKYTFLGAVAPLGLAMSVSLGSLLKYGL